MHIIYIFVLNWKNIYRIVPLTAAFIYKCNLIQKALNIPQIDGFTPLGVMPFQERVDAILRRHIATIV